jgi:hypothetical protein
MGQQDDPVRASAGVELVYIICWTETDFLAQQDFWQAPENLAGFSM